MRAPSEAARDAQRKARELLAEIAASVRDALLIAMPALIRGVCVGAAIAGVAYAFPRFWQAFGADPVALLPASALVLSPVAFALVAGLSWGGLLLSGAATFAGGHYFPTLHPIARGLLLAGVIGATVMHSLRNGGRYEHNAE